MAAAPIVFQQLTDIDVRGRIEDVVTNRDRRGVLALRIVSDFDLNIAFGKEREDQKAIAVGNVFDPAQVAIDHIAFHCGALEQELAQLFLLVANPLAALFHIRVVQGVLQRGIAEKIDDLQPIALVPSIAPVGGHGNQYVALRIEHVALFEFAGVNAIGFVHQVFHSLRIQKRKYLVRTNFTACCLLPAA